MEVYCGKDSSGDKSLTCPTKIVLYLCTNLLDAGRTLYMYNFYTSMELAYKSIQRKTYLVDTLKKHNTPDLIKKKLAKGEQYFQQSNSGCVVLKWKNKSDVLKYKT